LPARDAGAAADLALLIEAARIAGDIARQHFRANPEIWQKPDESPVTEADIAIDRVLRTDLLAARPGYGWLSEETEDDGARLRSERVFIVDPIDGTRAFIDGQTSFAHSLAVAEDGEVIAGVIYPPMKDKLYAAARGHGATLNEAPIRASGACEPRGAQVLATKPNMDAKHWPGGVPDFARVYRPSLAYRLALVAEGHFDGMVTFRDTWEWDIAAGDILVREAGGDVSDGTGRTPVYNAHAPKVAGLMAAGRGLHGTLLRHRLGQVDR
jgi:myo-inositol-1(or 4)-monophosphatase